MRRVPVAAADDIPEGTMQMVQVDLTNILVVHDAAGNWHATQGICTHEYFELDKGFLTAGTLTCALHLSRFDITDGEPLDPPAELPLAIYPVAVEDGRVMIEVPEGRLEINE